MLELGGTFVLLGKHELNDPVQAGKLPIYFNPGYIEDYVFRPERNDLLDILAERGIAGKSVVDVGTGAGFIAIACARLGASPVYAVENDDYPFQHAEANFALNQVDVKLIRRFEDAGQVFDLVINNMNVLSSYLALLPSMAKAMKHDGSMFLEVDEQALHRQAITEQGIPHGMHLLEATMLTSGVKVVKKIKVSSREFWEVKHA